MWAKQKAFTVVELLIVIVVIGILATLTIIAYRGVQDQAKVAVLKSDLTQIASKLETYKLKNAEQYPSSLAGASITGSPNVDFQYTYNNVTNPATFCITAVNLGLLGTGYYISNTNLTPTEGVCSGHTSNPGFTNLIANSNAETASATTFVARQNLFVYSYAYNQTSRTTGINYDGKTWERYALNSGITSGHIRHYTNLSDLVNGATYTTQWEVANDGASAVTVWGDWCDSSSPVVVVNPGETKILTTTQTRATYDSTFRFADFNLNGAAGSSVLVRNVMIERGTFADSYFNGSSEASSDFTYSWAGTVNASVSNATAKRVTGYQTNGTAAWYQSADRAYRGSKSIKVVSRGATNDGIFYHINNLPAGTYTYLVHVYRPGTSSFIPRSFYGLSTEGWGTPVVSASTDTWEELRRTFTTGVTQNIDLYVYMPATSSYNDVFYVDGFVLVSGNYSGPYFE